MTASANASVKKTREKLPACAVLLAGGRGTRFWPRSRTRTPKQLLNITGGETMLRQTVSRLAPLFAPRNFWAVTNVEQARPSAANFAAFPHRTFSPNPSAAIPPQPSASPRFTSRTITATR